MTRDLVLNTPSLCPPDRPTSLAWLISLAAGISELISHGIATQVLRYDVSLYGLRCLNGDILANPFQSLREIEDDNARDAADRLQRLLDRFYPSDVDLNGEPFELPNSCEANGRDSIELTGEQSKSLALCALMNFICVSFPSQDIWKQDALTVNLRFDGDIADRSEVVDNVSCLHHAEQITARNRELLRQCSSFREMWDRRFALFPNLYFGIEVEEQLNDLGGSLLGSVVTRLMELDQTADDWYVTGGSMPDWKCNVNRESPSTMNVRRYRQARTFRNRNGIPTVYERHAYIGDGRIHLVFDTKTREIEIGYIGRKLPPYRGHRAT